MKLINKYKLIGLFLSLFIVLIFIVISFQNSFSGLLSIHMIDVGQGDSFLIITPNHKTILVDAGELSEGRKVKAYLRKNRVKKVDLLIGTHPHSDHIGGLIEIINNFEVGEVVIPKKPHTSTTFENFLSSVESKQVSISFPTANNIIEFDEDIKLHFLGPLRDYGDHLNLWSIVFRLDYKDKSFLFTGDMEQEAEIDLIHTYGQSNLKSNVLKIGHHGSKTSTSEQFLNYVAPEIALISLGKDNPYGHPHNEVIERLEATHVFIYRTDIQHTLTILSDGIKIWSNQAPSNQKYNFQKLP